MMKVSFPKQRIGIAVAVIAFLTVVGISALRLSPMGNNSLMQSTPTPVPPRGTLSPKVSVAPTVRGIPTTRLLTPTPTSTTGTINITIGYYEQRDQSLSGIRIKTTAPNGQVFEAKTNDKGEAILHGLPPASYMLDIYDGKDTAGKNVSVSAGSTIAVSIVIWPGLVSPTPSPDTTAPTLHAIRGPFDWGNNGTCFLITDDDFDEEHSGNSISWKLDGEEWSAFHPSKGDFCYTNLSHGDHTFAAKMKNAVGLEGNTVSKSFTYPLP